MALTLDPATKIFTIAQSDLTLISGTFYSLDTNSFKNQVRKLLGSEAYIWMDSAITHNTEVTIAGTTYARLIEVINGYSVEFSPNSQYSVRLEGSNNNLFDIASGILNQNQVQVIPTNSAGLIVGEGGNVISGAAINQEVTIMQPDETISISSAIDNAVMIYDTAISVGGEVGQYVALNEPINSVRVCH